MGCWSPINLRSETQKKLGLRGTSVPCGRCLGCLSKKRADWTFRMMQELSVATSASFLTLTISDDVDIETGEITSPSTWIKILYNAILSVFGRLQRDLPEK